MTKNTKQELFYPKMLREKFRTTSIAKFDFFSKFELKIQKYYLYCKRFRYKNKTIENSLAG